MADADSNVIDNTNHIISNKSGLYLISNESKGNSVVRSFDCSSRIGGMQKRLKAALRYDGISDNEMASYVANKLKVSIPVAKRMLNGNFRTIVKRGLEVCDELRISERWLYFGELSGNGFHDSLLRTLRIHVQEYKGYPKSFTDKAMRLYVAQVAGLKRARHLIDLVADGKMNYIDAVMAF